MSRWSQAIAQLAKHPHDHATQGKALDSIQQEHKKIASDVNVCEQALAKIEKTQPDETLQALKATLSHNRFQLFQLQQQVDALQANNYMHNAHTKRCKNGGIVTALQAYSRVHTK